MDSEPAQQAQQGQTQYYCHECSTRTAQPMREPELHCPNCGSGALEEQESLAAESPFSLLGSGMPLGGPGMFAGMPTVVVRGHPQQQGEEAQREGETAGAQQGQGSSIMNLFSSFFGSGQQQQRPRRGAAPPGQGRGTTFTFTAGAAGPSFTRTSFSTQPTHDDPSDDPPDAEPQRQEQVPIRSLSDFLQHAFNGSPQPAPETRQAEPEQQRQPPDLAQALFSMLGGMARGERGGQTPTAEGEGRPAGRVYQGPGFSFFIGTNTGGGTRVGFPGQFGDFVFNENALDNVITMLMEQAGGHEGPRPAPEEMIRDLPRQTWTEELKTTAPITDCAVCKDDFENEDVTLSLPCHHVFHESCITPWLERSGTCPVCRHQLVEQPEAHPIAQGAMPGQPPVPPSRTRPPHTPGDVEMEPVD